MADTMRERSRSALPDRADRSAKAGIHKSDPVAAPDVRLADIAHARRVLQADILLEALLSLRLTRLKQQAAYLARDPRTLRRWFDALEDIPFGKLIDDAQPELKVAIGVALLASCQRDLVELRTVITVKSLKVPA